MKKVGIFSGTFDPIHEGHLAFARAALDAGLEKIWFIVEPRPRRKQGVRAMEHRRAMVNLTIKNEKKFGQIILEQARFTPHETIPVLQARFKGRRLVLLFGSDVLGHIAHWPHIQQLASSVDLLIASRQKDEKSVRDTLHKLEKTRSLHFIYEFVRPDKSDVSSSKIRLAIKKGQTPMDLPHQVAAYIEREKLYSPFYSPAE